MKLSTRSRYGLRLMFELAIAEVGHPVMLRDIAERQNLSEKYLGKLIILLRRAGLIRSVRGAHGGYMLSRAAPEISLKEIITALEGDLVLVDCTVDQTVCSRSARCPTRNIWCGLNTAVAGFLSGISLEDMIADYRSTSDREGDLYCI